MKSIMKEIYPKLDLEENELDEVTRNNLIAD
jgi:hypothetical protein